MNAENKIACKFLSGGETTIDHHSEELEIDYEVVERKVKELNEIGIDITLQEVGDIIETKFSGRPMKADLQRREEVGRESELKYPRYTLFKENQ